MPHFPDLQLSCPDFELTDRVNQLSFLWCSCFFYLLEVIFQSQGLKQRPTDSSFSLELHKSQLISASKRCSSSSSSCRQGHRELGPNKDKAAAGTDFVLTLHGPNLEKHFPEMDSFTGSPPSFSCRNTDLYGELLFGFSGHSLGNFSKSGISPLVHRICNILPHILTFLVDSFLKDIMGSTSQFRKRID